MKNIDPDTMSKKLLFSIVLTLIIYNVTAQHNHSAPKTESTPMSFEKVLSTMLSDPELKEYKMDAVVMTVVPGHTDTVSHRHDAELLGYVLEGKIEVSLEKKPTVTFNAGQMFYEKRNILHSLAKNPDQNNSAKVLLIYIIKNGRKHYIKEYPEVKK